jgi:trans-aconitate methyltransferase
MSSAHFSAEWLQQREPFDAIARDTAAHTLQLHTHWQALQPLDQRPRRIIDLACGAGSNLRWLAPRLGGDQQWLMVDQDADLLRRLPHQLQQIQPQALALAQTLMRTHVFKANIHAQQANLMTDLETLPWAAADLVTASALLDLVGIDWLHRLVELVVRHQLPVLMALNVDGRQAWSTHDDLDDIVLQGFAKHQHRDKGMGAALGANAAPMLCNELKNAGYSVHCATSDWLLDGQVNAQALNLQRNLLAGMASAAAEQYPHMAAQAQDWQRRRWALATNTHLRVGHLDVWAVPA